jgi:hypothetical protein
MKTRNHYKDQVVNAVKGEKNSSKYHMKPTDALCANCTVTEY